MQRLGERSIRGGDGLSSTYLTVLLRTKDASKGLGVLNQGGYSNSDVDRLIDESLATFDADRRSTLMAKAFDIALGTDQAALCFYYPIENYAARRAVTGYRADAYGRVVPGRATPA